MSESEIRKIEATLLPFAKRRTDPGQMGMIGGILKGFAGNIYENLINRLVQAFSRAILSVQDDIYLKDLATAVISEAGYMTEVRPYTINGRISTDADVFYQWQTEIHAWLIYLASEGILPGRYERFIGHFIRE
ncbi:MAG: hypothetical protein K9W44_17300 [Candidatus Lokiarchaeota archaeon]|nr:hypothetical protein [Candidatus Harpocratesius repetitus]